VPLRIGIVDANEKTRDYLRGQITSYIGFWLKWEMEQVELRLCSPNEADLIFLVHTGSKRFGENVRREMRHFGLEPYSEKRGPKPYIITGGSVDA
jgi:hypothetical protein